MGSYGFPRISYIDNSSNLKFLTCLNAACTSKSINTLSSGGAGHNNGTSLILLSSDLPLISYENTTPSADLAVAAFAVPYKLQFATQGSGCSSATYSDVTGTSVIANYNNATPSDRDAISSTGSDPTDTGQTVSTQTYVEGTYFSNTSAIGLSTDGEWDFSLYDNGATAGTSYCLRMVQWGGTTATPFTTYTNYPVITTASSGPTTDQILRGGAWFNGGTKQPLFWAN